MSYFTTTPKGRCPTCGKCLDCEERGKMTPFSPMWVGDAPSSRTDKYYGTMPKAKRSDFVTTSTQAGTEALVNLANKKGKSILQEWQYGMDQMEVSNG